MWDEGYPPLSSTAVGKTFFLARRSLPMPHVRRSLLEGALRFAQEIVKSAPVGQAQTIMLDQRLAAEKKKQVRLV